MKFAGVLASTNKANVESATVDNRPAGVYKLGAELTYIDDSGVEHTIVGTTVYEMN